MAEAFRVRTDDAVTATRLLRVAARALRLVLIERWGERLGSMGREWTRFERMAQRHGEPALAHRIAVLAAADTDSAPQRADVAPPWLQERIDLCYGARIAVGEEVTWAENARSGPRRPPRRTPGIDHPSRLRRTREVVRVTCALRDGADADGRLPYPAPVTLLATGAPYPVWDPMPRPPRRTASWIALALVGVAGIVAAVGVGSVFGARYAARADVCSAVDLRPVGTALGRPGLTAVATNSPDSDAGPTELVCRFTVAESGGAVRAVGTVTAIWYDNAFMGRFFFETRREQAAGSIYQRSGLAELTGLGDAAFTYHDDDRRFRVATRDSNLVLDLQVAVAAGDPAWQPGQVGAPFAALTDTIRASLPRLR